MFDPHIAASFDGKLRPSMRGIRHRVDHTPTDNRIDITLESGRHGLALVAESRRVGRSDRRRGLEVEALYGGFEREPFTEESREFVWVARKPA